MIKIRDIAVGDAVMVGRSWAEVRLVSTALNSVSVLRGGKVTTVRVAILQAHVPKLGVAVTARAEERERMRLMRQILQVVDMVDAMVAAQGAR